MRKRCEKCQQDYNDKYVKKCPSCYKTKKEQEKQRIEIREKKEKRESKEPREEKECYNRDCKNTTIYKFCKKCNDNKKQLDSYMVFTCKGCGLKGRGDYSYCSDCK